MFNKVGSFTDLVPIAFVCPVLTELGERARAMDLFPSFIPCVLQCIALQLPKQSQDNQDNYETQHHSTILTTISLARM